MRRSIYDDSLELLCPDANAPLPLTPPTGIGAAGDGDGDSDGTDVLRIIVTEKSNDWIKIQFKNEDGQQCTTEELNKSGSMSKDVRGQKIVTYKGSVLKPLDTQCQQTLSADYSSEWSLRTRGGSWITTSCALTKFKSTCPA